MAESEVRTINGACLCEAVRFEVDLPTLFCAHCHCTMCQRAHGAGYVTWIGVPYERFRLVEGAERLIEYKSSDHGRRRFCGTCGSSLFCESSHHPDVIDLVLANLEEPIDRTPDAHFYYEDRAAWVDGEDALPRFGGPTGNKPLDPGSR